MPHLEKKGEPFQAGQMTLSAEQLNDLRRAVIREARGGKNVDVGSYGDRLLVSSDPSIGSLPALGHHVFQFIVLEELNDTLKCTPFLAPDKGGQWVPWIYNVDDLNYDPQTKKTINLPIYYVAKPYLLQTTPFLNQVVYYMDGSYISFMAASLLGSLATNQTDPQGNLIDIFSGGWITQSLLGDAPILAIPKVTGSVPLTGIVTYYYTVAYGTDGGPVAGNIEPVKVGPGQSVILDWKLQDGANTATKWLIWRSSDTRISDILAGSDLNDMLYHFSDLIAELPGNQFTFTDTFGSPVGIPVLGTAITGTFVVSGSTFTNTTPKVYFKLQVIFLDGTISNIGPELIVDPSTLGPGIFDLKLTWTAVPNASEYLILTGDNPGQEDPDFAIVIIASTVEYLFNIVDKGRSPALPVFNVFEIQDTIPQYFLGDVISAIRMVTGYTGPDGFPILWIDMNFAGRIILPAIQNFVQPVGDNFIDNESPYSRSSDLTTGLKNTAAFSILQVDFNSGLQLDSTGLPFGTVVLHTVQADPTTPGILSLGWQYIRGIKQFLEGEIIIGGTASTNNPSYLFELNPPFADVYFTPDGDQQGSLIGLTHASDGSALTQAFDVYTNDAKIVCRFVFGVNCPTNTGGPIGLNANAFGFAIIGNTGNTAGLQMSFINNRPGMSIFVSGDPFAGYPPILDASLAIGSLNGYNLFTGVDTTVDPPVKYICGLRIG